MSELAVSSADLEALAAAVLSTGSSFRFRARGASMRPSIRDGDILEIQPVDAGAICRGDVVLCRAGEGRLFAHRVIRVTRMDGRMMVATQGDALACPDGLFAPEQVLGRAVAVEREGRRARLDTLWQRLSGLLWTKSPLFKYWLRCTPATLRRRVLARRMR
jgi:hypothetical protein